jgi:hypothetical protein
VDYLYTS